jgi:hypothetical protein
LGLSAEIIAPKKELAGTITSGTTDSRVFTGWRRGIIGDSLLKML